MREYVVKIDNNGSESAFFGFMFRDAVISCVSCDKNTETYKVTSERALEDALDDSEGVIEYECTAYNND